MPYITFQPSGRRIEVGAGASVLDAAISANETAVVCCGIDPSCGHCKLAVMEGEENLSPPNELEAEHLRANAFLPFERLGCMVEVLGDVVVEVEE